MKRRFSRREFLATTAKLGAVGAVGSVLPLPRWSPRVAGADTFSFTTAQRATLDAALARMIPADPNRDPYPKDAGNWSAADVGAGNYIEGLLSLELDPKTDPAGTIFAGGPFRNAGTPDPTLTDPTAVTATGFSNFQTLSRVKLLGWQKEIERLRGVYAAGLADLDARAVTLGASDFTKLTPEEQDAVLTAVDLTDPPNGFFAALYAHTMEGVYGHPVYGGNQNYQAWNSLSYLGDVHGVHYPDGQGADDSPWNQFGGYSPDEMEKPD